VPIPENDFAQLDPAEVRRRFDETYSRLYGRTYPEAPVEFVNFRVRASLPVRRLELPRAPQRGGHVREAVKGERKAYSGPARGFIPFTVYDRYLLFPGAEFYGPAIVEERESTVIVGEDAQVRVDEFGFLWIAMPP
jgi:N-methylhydantoinase A